MLMSWTKRDQGDSISLGAEGTLQLAVQADKVAAILLDSKAFVFVCGDGARMAKDVNATLASILEQQGSMSATDAAAHLTSMTKAGRYIRDIWS